MDFCTSKDSNSDGQLSYDEITDSRRGILDPKVIVDNVFNWLDEDHNSRIDKGSIAAKKSRNLCHVSFEIIADMV